MKPAIILSVAAVVAACAPEPDVPVYRSASKQCATIGALGAVVMAARQTGRTRNETLRSLDDGAESNLTQLTEVLVKSAYQVPIRRTKRAKEAEVKRFSASTTILCQRARQRTLGGA